MLADPRSSHRFLALLKGAVSPPPGKKRISVAVIYGVAVHGVFGLAAIAMIAGMYNGMTLGLMQVEGALSIAWNAFLLLQFPLAHSFLLTRAGQRVLKHFAPRAYASTLLTTTYGLVASIQILMLFALWSPSGVVWWQAKDGWLVLITILFACSWLLLGKATYDAGLEVQSGALGWLSLVQNKEPVFPPMPETGLYKLIRHPIYVAFALTTWTVPVWTPDQLAIAISLTLYCFLAPLFKERRMSRLHGKLYSEYRNKVPYCIPDVRRQNRGLTDRNTL